MSATLWSPNSTILAQVNAQGLIKQETQTATAGQSLFTLASFAYAPNTGSLLVFKNGKVLTRIVDYTETSTLTVVLTTPATVGDTITFVGYVGITATTNTDPVLRADLAASSGAGLVGWIQAGVGAILRTLQSKTRETVSIADFGAVLDGVTDDIDAIDKAITYMSVIGGGTVKLGRGIVGISRKINPKRGVTIQGESGFDYSAYPTIKGSTIKPLAGYSDGHVILADSAQDATKLQSGNGFENFAIDMSNISALGGRAITLRSVTNIGVFRNIAIYNMDDGIGLELDQSGVASSNATDGIDIISFFTYGKTPGFASALPRVQITNNVNEINFRGCKFQSKSNAVAGTIAARVYSGGRGILFDGCSFAGCETGVSIFANNESNSPPEWVRFFNNTFETYRVGIYIDSVSGSVNFYPRRIHVDRSNRFIVATGANCRKIYANKVNDSFFAADDWMEASTSGVSYLVELTTASVGCIVEATPTQVINPSATSVVYGRNGNGLQTVLYRETTIATALATGWTNASPTNRTSAGYWKDSHGAIHLQGYVGYSSGGSSLILTLPAGYVPNRAQILTVTTNTGAGSVLINQIGSGSDGQITQLSGGTGWVSLDGLCFSLS